MKMVTAFIQPFKLEDVTRALSAIPEFPGMTVSEMRGFGREHLEQIHDRLEALTDFRSGVRVEILVEDETLLESVVKALRTAAHTGRRGDGKVMVSPLEQAQSIREDVAK